MTTDPKVLFRSATIQDCERLKAWDQQPHVIAGKGSEDWEWDISLRENPSWREQLIAEVDGEPVGFVQIVDPAEEVTHYWGAVDPGFRALDIWIGKPDLTGQGLGTSMMKLAIDRCFTDESVNGIFVDPLAHNRRVHRFYERLGFRFVEVRTFDDEHCHVYLLTRDAYASA